MIQKLKHNDGPVCKLCEHRALELHEKMKNAWKKIKEKFIDCHICEAWRSKEDQELIFQKGLSKVQWPLSRHNRTKCGIPCSEAMDLFQLKDGTAVFDMTYYRKINLYCQELALPIEAGCTWRIQDGPHFQLR